MDELLIWGFLNVIVALSPLAIIAIALHVAEKPKTIGTILGDGFLFFFTVTLMAGLISDISKDLISRKPHNTLKGSVPYIIFAVVMIMAALVAYLAALIVRFQKSDDDGSGYAVPSLILALIGLCISVWLRHTSNLW